MRAPARTLALAAVALALALAVTPVHCGRETPFVAGELEPGLRFTDLEGDISESGGVGRAKDSSRLSDISGEVKSVELLGATTPVKWTRDAAGLHVVLPAARPTDYALALRIATR
jgi:hypothetical protein